MKINEKILSLPPYISTNWSHVAALHMKGHLLVISLTDGNTIAIPNLAKELIDSAFLYHSLYLENEEMKAADSLSQKDAMTRLDQVGAPTIRFAFGSLDGLNHAMQHNPAQANAPDLPPEILQKVSHLAKMMSPDDETILPKAETDCNCFHCQIARAINPSKESVIEEEEEEEVVADNELEFQQWTIAQTGDQLFSVTNRLDEHEKYSVFLGHPVGCTCGKQGCEHILAVLKS